MVLQFFLFQSGAAMFGLSELCAHKCEFLLLSTTRRTDRRSPLDDLDDSGQIN